jgi:hypothetical protein
VTVTEAGPPDEPTDNDDGERVNVHGPGDGLVGEPLPHDVTITPSAKSKGKWNKDFFRITPPMPSRQQQCGQIPINVNAADSRCCKGNFSQPHRDLPRESPMKLA